MHGTSAIRDVRTPSGPMIRLLVVHRRPFSLTWRILAAAVYNRDDIEDIERSILHSQTLEKPSHQGTALVSGIADRVRYYLPREHYDLKTNNFLGDIRVCSMSSKGYWSKLKQYTRPKVTTILVNLLTVYPPGIADKVYNRMFSVLPRTPAPGSSNSARLCNEKRVLWK